MKKFLKALFEIPACWLLLLIFVLLTGNSYSAPHRLIIANNSSALEIFRIVQSNPFHPTETVREFHVGVPAYGVHIEHMGIDAYSYTVERSGSSVSGIAADPDGQQLVYWDGTSISRVVGRRAGAEENEIIWPDALKAFIAGLSLLIPGIILAHVLRIARKGSGGCILSTYFVVGLKGNGKTLMLVHRIVRALVTTERTIVTTLTELRVDRLMAYIAEKHPHRNIDYRKRLVIIPKEKTGEFYRWRANGLVLPDPPRFAKTADSEYVDRTLQEYFSPAANANAGVDYFLTEVHRHMKADRWSEMSDTTMFYLTQSRHFDDTQTFESQLPKQVVVQLRDLCDECIEMRNHYKQRFGFFKKRGCFMSLHYYGVPKPGAALEPFETRTFTLDAKGIASLYATRGAVTGVGEPETPPQTGGLPFWSMFVIGGAAAILLPLMLWFGFMWGQRALQSGLKKLTGESEKVARAVVKSSTPPGLNQSLQTPTTDLSTGTMPIQPETYEPVLIGVLIARDGRAAFQFSNGQLVMETDPILTGSTYDRRTRVLTLAGGRRFPVVSGHQSVPTPHGGPRPSGLVPPEGLSQERGGPTRNAQQDAPQSPERAFVGNVVNESGTQAAEGRKGAEGS